MSTAIRFAMAVLLLSTPLAAQTTGCNGSLQPGAIPNFRGTSTPSSFTVTWDPPAGTVGSPVYEILQETATDYCNIPGKFSVIATTTTNSYTRAKTQANVVYVTFVQLQSDPCKVTATTYITDSFSSPPSKPPAPTVTGIGRGATITVPYSDSHSNALALERASGDGRYTIVAARTTAGCDPDPKVFTDAILSAGAYNYRLVAFNDGSSTGLAGVSGEATGISIGASPDIVGFNASPTTIRAGQSATLTWRVVGASSLFIDQGVGSVHLAGSTTVTPKSTTIYTLTAISGNAVSTASITVNVITQPIVAVGELPGAVVQTAGSGGGTTSYTLANAGGSPTTVTLSQNGTFFTQSPTSFTLAPGATQVVTVTGTAQPAGVQQGQSIPSGAGVASGTQIPIRMLSVAPPAGKVTAKSEKNRIDVSAFAGNNPSGTVSYTNTGTTTLEGMLISDVPWILPQSGSVTIAPGATNTFTFTIDRTLRPDASLPTGSTRGNLNLVYLNGGSGATGKLASNDTSTVSVNTTTLVDTVKLMVNTKDTPLPLAANEVALFVPGIGHVQGSVGTFISDLSVLNPNGTKTINDLKMYYTPVGAAPTNVSSAQLSALSSNVSVPLADVASSVFSNSGNVASLMIRSADAGSLAVNANIFNSSNPAGSYGTAIPTFRSDRAVTAGDNLVLTGLRSDSSTHTNLFIQETSGAAPATVQTQFFDVNGANVSTRVDVAPPFGLLQINSQVPSGAVSAIMTNTGTGATGSFLAYATPVDNDSGDNWAVADWARLAGDVPGAPTVVPVAGSAQGANNTFFRTDLAIMNSGTSSGSGTLTYFPRGGTAVSKTVSLGAHQSSIISDVIGSVCPTCFNMPATLGYMTFTPISGTFAVTSRTFSTDTTHLKPGTFGSGVPAVANASALMPGSFRAIGNLDDAALATVLAAKPYTFRTNMGLMETSGAPVTVRVTIRFSYQLAKVAGNISASKDYTLGANQFMQVPMVSDIIGDANRAMLPDLTGIEADFQVIDGTGTAVVYTSSTDNGTGDLILRTE